MMRYLLFVILALALSPVPLNAQEGVLERIDTLAGTIHKKIAGELPAPIESTPRSPLAPPSTPPPPASLSERYEGLGAQTAGGSNGKIYEVTNPISNGPGGLNSKVLTIPGQRIVFKVNSVTLGTGEYQTLDVTAKDITLDGCSAPQGFVTFDNTILIKGARPGSPNLDVRNIIFDCVAVLKKNNGNQYALNIFAGYSSERTTSTVVPSNILIQNSTFAGASDDQIAFAGAKNITFRRNLIRDPTGSRQNMWVCAKSEHVLIQENFFAPNSWRNPLICHNSLGGASVAPTVTAWFVNNLVFVGNLPNSTVEALSIWQRAKVVALDNTFLGAPVLAAPWGDMRHWISLCTAANKPNGTKQCGGAYTSSGGGTISVDDAAAAGFLLNGNVLKSAYATTDPTDKNINFNAGDPAAPFGIRFTRGKAALTSACDVLKFAGARPLGAADQVYFQSAARELAKFHSC